MFKSTVFAASLLAGLLAISADDAAAQSKKKSKEPPPPAKNGADITILEGGLTKLQFVSCGKDDAYITGIIAVTNKGNERAERLVAAPIAAVYVPEHLDLKDEKIVPNSLSTSEIFTTDVVIGKGTEKFSRGLDKPRTVYVVVDPYNKIIETNENNNIVKFTVKPDPKKCTR